MCMYVYKYPLQLTMGAIPTLWLSFFFWGGGAVDFHGNHPQQVLTECTWEESNKVASLTVKFHLKWFDT